MEDRKRAEYIIEILRPCLKKSHDPDWSTYRYRTAWGTKTEEGLVQVVLRILVASEEGLPKLEE